MVTVFSILLLVGFAQIVRLIFKMSWGVIKALFFIVFLPIAIICLLVFGIVYLAIPVLLIVGAAALVKRCILN